jgi:DNA topoisomerase IB
MHRSALACNALQGTPPEPVPAGLVWVSDAEPGYQRVKLAGQVHYLDTHGKRLRDQATLARIRKLAIPPAYEQVWICAQANGHLQATGRDARGRKQYRYHPQWQQQRGDDKFESMRAFGAALPRLRRAVARDLSGHDTRRPTRTPVLATLVRLLDTTYLRIGNEQYARGNGSYGLTTLRTRLLSAAERRLLALLGPSAPRRASRRMSVQHASASGTGICQTPLDRPVAPAPRRKAPHAKDLGFHDAQRAGRPPRREPAARRASDG